MAAKMSPARNFVLRSSLTILGAPGSGKGFYGRLLAETWQVPLFSVSRILRQSGVLLDLDSGSLVDCSTVSDTLLDFLQARSTDSTDTTSSSHRSESATNESVPTFLMDGFPRTQRQIDLMNESWPKAFHIRTAFRLNVPDEVCAQKIAGRRVCSVCQQEPNDADVNSVDFVLPPTRPLICQNQCNPDQDWKRRLDDESRSVVAKRLAEYRHHEQQLVDYYSATNGLVSFTPYHGIKDAPRMQQSLEQWFANHDRQ